MVIALHVNPLDINYFIFVEGNFTSVIWVFGGKVLSFTRELGDTSTCT
jgi:hypothetical protein